ncbi:interferon-activable protein 203-like [Perognathus longimembris pacificus]|uniref:interferon-activable protein 203-like n=1 Tax=Perognathus longimembris pacificus TaxID=214514 RepID=UPI0020190990|nr:interferon-activable protein 203-like [Perognathus longimembris pacificus]
MANPYKKIVLLKGLEGISDYHFELIKSLLAKELKLNRKAQEDCNRIRMADLMEDKFRSDCGLGKLMDLFKDISELQDLAETLKKEKSKVQRKSKGKEATLGQNNNQDEPSGAQSTPANNADLKSKKSKAKAKRTEDSERIQEQRQHPEPSMTDTQQTQGSSQTPKPLPPASSRNFSTKQPGAMSVSGINEQGNDSPHPQAVKKKVKSIQIKVEEQNLQAQRRPQLPGTSATSTHPRQPQPQPHPNPPRPCSQKLHCQDETGSSDIGTLNKGMESRRFLQLFQVIKIELRKSTFLQAEEKTTSNMDDREQNLLSTRFMGLPGTSATRTHLAQPQPQPHPNPPPPAPSSSTAKKPRMMVLPKDPAKVEMGFHREFKEVMVLKVTPLFVYDGDKTMFHATVATESEFFRVKVFDVKLQAVFIPNKIVILSEYYGNKGFLEIYSNYIVRPGQPERIMNIPPTMRLNACATPKISCLCTLHPGKFVNGIFLVHKKIVRDEFIYYEIQDNTGKMEVVVRGRLTQVDCEEGDKVKLICFELAMSMDKWQLKSVLHSYMEVIKSRKGKTQVPTSNQDTVGQSSNMNYWMPGSSFN